ncbi:MAG TPA: phage holin family protein [Polyangiaceae bacterium]|nr:phage holin family protein [Polyangiaceae bacterium]
MTPSRREARSSEVALDPRERRSLDHAPTGELIKQALDDARDLVRIEVGLAKEEARTEIKSLKHAAIAGTIALVVALLFLSALTTALVFALAKLPHGADIALVLAGVYLVASVIAGWLAYRLAPKAMAASTRRNLESDIRQIKEITRHKEHAVEHSA